MTDGIPEGWSVESFRDISEKIQDGTHFSPKSKSGNYLYVTSKNIRQGKLDLSSVQYISKEEHDQIYKRCDVRLGDILFTKDGANTGNAALNHLYKPFSLLSSVAFVRCKQDLCHNQYLFQYILFEDCQKQIADSMTGNAITRLTLEKINGLTAIVPPLPEQQKIASILTSVDEVIGKTEAQISKLQDLKKGMMQQLLTQGIGHTEFRDSPVGRIPKEWDVRSLPAVCTNHDSKRVPIKASERASMKGKYPYYGASGVIDYVNDYIFDDEHILLGEDGENVLSRNLPLAFIARGKYWVNNHAHVLKPKHGIDIGFLCEYLESLDYKNIASGSAQPKITQDSLNRIKVPIPSEAEQVAIGDSFRALDRLIHLRKQELEQRRKIKKALMQDLLTGKVRVKVN